MKLARVAVLMGGSSNERNISLQSGQTVVDSLKRQGIFVEAIDWHPRHINALIQGDFDCVFIALHGRGGEDGSVQGLLESLNIPYTGSGVLASALAMNKVFCKRLWQSIGIDVPNFWLLDDNCSLADLWGDLTFPLFVKPIFEGCSIGINYVESAKDLAEAVSNSLAYGEVFLEEAVFGREITVPLLINQVLPEIETVTKRTFCDYTAKFSLAKDNQYFCPAKLDVDERTKLIQVTKKACKIIGIQGFARCDFIYNQSQGKFYLLEVNAIPGLTSHSYFPMSVKAQGSTIDDAIMLILADAMKRARITSPEKNEVIY